MLNQKDSNVGLFPLGPIRLFFQHDSMLSFIYATFAHTSAVLSVFNH